MKSFPASLLVCLIFIQSVPGHAAPTVQDLVWQDTKERAIDAAKELHAKLSSWESAEKATRLIEEKDLRDEMLNHIHQLKSQRFEQSEFTSDENTIRLKNGNETVSIDLNSNVLKFKTKEIQLKGKSLAEVYQILKTEVTASTTTFFGGFFISEAHAVLPVLALIWFVMEVIMIIQGLISVIGNLSCQSMVTTFQKSIADRLDSCIDYLGQSTMPYEREDKKMANLLDSMSDQNGFNEKLCRNGVKNNFRADADLLFFSIDYSCILNRANSLCQKLKELDRCYSRDRVFVNNYDRLSTGGTRISPATAPRGPVSVPR